MEKREIRKCNMADVICEVATIIAENGCDPEQLWQLEHEQLCVAKNLLAYIKAWTEIMHSNMPTIVQSAWANAEKHCTMMTKDDYSKGPNQAMLAEVRRLQGTPEMTAAELVSEPMKEAKEP